MPKARVNRHATDLLRRHRRYVDRVVKVYSAGDPGAVTDDNGIPRETLLYVTPDGQERTAILVGADPKMTVKVKDGWAD